MVKKNAFFLRSGAKQGYLLLPLLFNIVLVVLARTYSLEKKSNNSDWKEKLKPSFIYKKI